MGRRIEIVDYDEAWPEHYRAEADRLRSIFGYLLESIHHVGSTSVPGLRSKPVIDILIVAKDDSTLGRYDNEMISLGYTPRGECLDAGGTPGRFYYSKNTGGQRTHQVHICRTGHFQVAEMVAFPRFLRADPEAAAAYAAAKEEAARQNRNDIAGYIKAKSAFIRASMRKALDVSQGA